MRVSRTFICRDEVCDFPVLGSPCICTMVSNDGVGYPSACPYTAGKDMERFIKWERLS